MMTNLKNCLIGINIEDDSFSFFKEKLQKEYSFISFNDMLSLTCMQHNTKQKILLLLSVLEDQDIDDKLVGLFCKVFGSISGELWDECKNRLKSFIEEHYYLLQHNQLLSLANTIEVMSAKRYHNAFELANVIYQRIPLNNYEFNPDSDENVRIRLAKLAYSTHQYNFNEIISEIENIKKHLKITHRKYLLGMLNYYKGLCLGAVNETLNYKNANDFIAKSNDKGFALASIYLCYSSLNFETSRGQCKPC